MKTKIDGGALLPFTTQSAARPKKKSVSNSSKLAVRVCILALLAMSSTRTMTSNRGRLGSRGNGSFVDIRLGKYGGLFYRSAVRSGHRRCVSHQPMSLRKEAFIILRRV